MLAIKEKAVDANMEGGTKMPRKKNEATGITLSKLVFAIIIGVGIAVLLTAVVGGYIWGRNVGYGRGYEVGYNQGKTEGEKIGYSNGFSDGKKAGYDDGYQVGKKDGYDQGNKDGYNQGYQKGKGDGYNQGESAGYNRGLSQASYTYSMFWPFPFHHFWPQP